jgi:hypothetical protein
MGFRKIDDTIEQEGNRRFMKMSIAVIAHILSRIRRDRRRRMTNFWKSFDA